MKKLVKSLIVLFLLFTIIVTLTACDEKKEEKTESKVSIAVAEKEVKDLSDEEKIEHVLYQLLKDAYGKDLDAAKIYIDKMYKKAEADEDETLKTLKLGDKDIAFEATIYLFPAEGADINKLSMPDGEVDEEQTQVMIGRLGVLKYDSENKTYSIDHYGTGW